MSPQQHSAGNPAVTVILPTYNRAPFLAAALESVSRQTFTDWELVIVDDGSTDHSREIAEGFEGVRGRMRYVHQNNAGAYAARNRGLDDARGRYVAFFDSDDLWLPHHLERCAHALDQHEDVDWVFGACRMVEHATGRTLEPTTFHVAGRPRPFLSLTVERDGPLHIITDPGTLECQILHGLYCGLQNSVIRRRLFDRRRFNPESRVVDDEMFVIRVLAAGARFAYFLDPHVIYHVHEDNSSASATGAADAKRIAIFTEMTRELEELLSALPLSARERRAMRTRMGREYFWHLGYGAYWQAGLRREALDAFWRGLMSWPWNPASWKTYLIARLRVACRW